MYMLMHIGAHTHTKNKTIINAKKGIMEKNTKKFYFYGLFLLSEIKRKTLKITFNMF